MSYRMRPDVALCGQPCRVRAEDHHGRRSESGREGSQASLVGRHSHSRVFVRRR